MNPTTGIRYFEEVNLFEYFSQNSEGKGRHEGYLRRTFKKGKYIYFSGDMADKVFFIHKGAVKIGNYTETGDESIAALLYHGEIFGELAVYGEENRSEYARAIEDTEVYILRKEEVMHLMTEVEGFMSFLNKVMAERIISAQKRLESLLYKDVKTRVAEYILQQADKNGKVLLDGAVFLPNHLTHQEIALFIGASRQTVTTLLNKFREERVLDFDRKRMTIRNVAALRQIGRKKAA